VKRSKGFTLKRSKHASGFTLIELLTAISLFSILCVAIFFFALSSLKVMTRAADNAGSMQVVRFVAGRMAADIMQSSGAGNGSGPACLILGSVSYEFRDGKLRRQEGNDIYYLTTEGEIVGFKLSYTSTRLIRIDTMPKVGGTYSVSVYARN